MQNLVMRYQGQAVEIRDHNGRVHRGMLEGIDPPRGMFIHDGFRRRFIPFFLIASIFLLSGRRRRRRIF
jgi:hypothetical protein